jgi:vancomycin resistance protein YoaR
MLSGPLVLRLGDKSWTWHREKIASILGISEVLDMDGRRTAQVSIDDKALTAELELLRGEVQVEPENARFDFANGRMVPIYAGRPGTMLDVGMSVKMAKEALLREENREVVLPTRSVQPAIAAEDGPMLGIRELIQEASTVYGGTLPERMHNVELAASRLHGVVVPPGQTFSFNETVGEVSYRNGYKKGYGITQSEGEVVTIPSEGGGICQVATTLFQSVFWAGLPVVERNWHLYWIPRYGRAPNGITGLDATVDQVFDKNYNLLYEVDFKFQNNTGNYLLIQTEADEKNIYFRLYGTNPNWSVIVEEPVIKDEVKANPTPVREPDESLEPGEEIVLEAAHDGFRVVLKRVVMREDEIIDEQTFVSTYKPSRNYSIFGPSPDDEQAGAETPGPSDETGDTQEDRPAGTPEPDSQ